MTRLDRRSEAQANAEALARRSSTFATEHAESWQVRFDRGREPRTLHNLVTDLRRAYQDEVPGKLHKGYSDVDAGGTPAFSGEFASYLYASPTATDRHDDEAGEVYATPFRAALARTTGTHRAIVAAVVLAGESPVDAAVALGIPADVAKITTEGVLRRFWRGMSSIRLPGSVSMA